jgi:hypothetical protein
MEQTSSHQNSYADVKTLISWSAPGRPYRKKTKEFYLSGLLIVFLIEVILFIFSQYLLMFVVIALFFFAVSLAAVPPQNFHYKVNTQGIKVEDHFYIWDELYDFYFKKIDGTEVLIVRASNFIPGELKIPLGSVSMDHMRRILVAFLPYREVVRSTFLERSGEWLARNFPLER